MSATGNSYKRLPGTGYRQLVPPWAMALLFLVIGVFVLLLRGRRVQLWTGKDHLLIVEWNGYTENYKRVQYSDIQWMSMHKTDAFIGTNGLLATLMAVFLVIAVLAPDSTLRGIFLVVSSLAMALLAGNIIAGPTCKSFLGTAVQTEDLVSLTRIKKARKVFDTLRPVITAAQTAVEAPSPAPSPVAQSPADDAQAPTPG
jgi:hypothetical protein